MSDDAHKWFTSWMPLAREAGPALTVVLACILVISTWWLVGKIDLCIERNRALSDKLVTQQEAFQREVLLRLAHCPPPH